MVEISDTDIPLPRPHFALRDGQLFFLASRRPYATLDVDDQRLWQSIDGTKDVAALRAERADADAGLARLHALGVCEIAEPDFPRNRRRVLVIEPHMDDAVLSVGGEMSARRHECEFTVATLASRSNYTSYYTLQRDYFDVDTVSALRASESALAMRLVGGHHRSLGLNEAPLRFHDGNWTADWYRGHHKLVDAYIMHPPARAEIDAWATAIASLLRSADADEIWMPLGVGSHTDHELARDACLEALRRIGGVRQSVFFYQEVPYAAQFPAQTASIVAAFADAGATLTPNPVDITAAIEAKRRLVSIFGSQFKPSYMLPRVDDAARGASGSPDRCAELRFRLDGIPRALDPVAVHALRPEIERIVPDARAFLERNREASRIRVLSPVPVGRWTDDVTRLLEWFPRASLEIHVSAEYVDEVVALSSPRVAVHVVPGREAHWIGRLALYAPRPTPTIMLAGEKLAKSGHLAKAAFARSRPLVATRMHYVVLALRRITSS